jgi:pyruvate-formate lyase-activating enzyme
VARDEIACPVKVSAPTSWRRHAVTRAVRPRVRGSDRRYQSPACGQRGVDPVEKKPLNHFLPGTSVLSFGTAGCNLCCRFCQNWDISKSREFDTLADAATPEAIARAAERLGCASVAFTYNDPVIFMEYAMDVADACHARGIKAVAVTAGYMCPAPRAEFYAHMDAANVDLKGFTERFYAQTCSGHLQSVLDTLIYLRHETDVWFEITNLLIPGLNDSDEELDRMTSESGASMTRRPPWPMTRSPACTSPSWGQCRRTTSLAWGVPHGRDQGDGTPARGAAALDGVGGGQGRRAGRPRAQ